VKENAIREEKKIFKDSKNDNACKEENGKKDDHPDIKLTPPNSSSLANNSSNSSVALNLSSQRHRIA